MVTGASSGLAAIFAQRLGERGFNLLLTGRHPDRLEQVRQRVIADARDCMITLLTADLATGDGVLALLRGLGDRPVDLLVNNAGFGTYGPFDRSDTAREMDVIGVDIAAPRQVSWTPSKTPRRRRRPSRPSSPNLGRSSTLACEPSTAAYRSSSPSYTTRPSRSCPASPRRLITSMSADPVSPSRLPSSVLEKRPGSPEGRKIPGLQGPVKRDSDHLRRMGRTRTAAVGVARSGVGGSVWAGSAW